MAENPILLGRSKHVDIKFHFIRDLLKDGKIKLKYCASKDMRADVLTKVLTGEAFQRHKDHIVTASDCGGVLNIGEGSKNILGEKVLKHNEGEQSLKDNGKVREGRTMDLSHD